MAVMALATGCRRRSSTQPVTSPSARPTASSAPPDTAALVSARDIESTLLAGFDRQIATSRGARRARLEVARAIHATHLDALRAPTSGTPTPTTTPASADPTDTAAAKREPSVATTLAASVPTLRRLSLAARSGSTAALLASIAASHQTALT
jgi:hypothetical protein